MKDVKAPQVTYRGDDTVDKYQRKVIEEQKTYVELMRNKIQYEIIGLVNSKIYANVQMSSDKCYHMCESQIYKEIKGSHVENNLKMAHRMSDDFVNKEVEKSLKGNGSLCLDRCMKKNMESFKMLLNVNLYLIG